MQRLPEPLKMPQQATVQTCLSLMSPYMPSFPRIQSELLLTHYTPWPYSLIQALSLNSYDALFSTLTSCLRSTYSYAISYFHLGPTNLNASSKLNSSPPNSALGRCLPSYEASPIMTYQEPGECLFLPTTKQSSILGDLTSKDTPPI